MAIESIKKTYGLITQVQNDLDLITTAKVKLQLPKNKVAFVKQVTFHVGRPLIIGSQVARKMCLMARSDVPDTDLEDGKALRELMDRPDVVTFFYYDTVRNSSTNIDGIFHTVVIPIPEPGFPVVNDMTLLYTGTISVAANENFHSICEVFYVDKDVSKSAWMMYAKRSLNAPRDLNVAQDPGGTWKGGSGN